MNPNADSFVMETYVKQKYFLLCSCYPLVPGVSLYLTAWANIKVLLLLMIYLPRAFLKQSAIDSSCAKSVKKIIPIFTAS